MEPIALAGMIFSLLVLLLVGGFILLFPLTRRLGAVLEQWLAERKLSQGESGETRQLRAALQALQDEVRQLAERQQFMETLLEAPRNSAALAAGATPASAPHPERTESAG